MSGRSKQNKTRACFNPSKFDLVIESNNRDEASQQLLDDFLLVEYCYSRIEPSFLKLNFALMNGPILFYAAPLHFKLYGALVLADSVLLL